ncbi:hypothetical protein [Roseimaritima multifibrata]|uniref:hypothetical protein n=1 Tax=Roseimaritima multifibrata TaxID=1930274 RepID=UPI0011A59B27|nr:hypothetical protein [Roseimaritima multifibrata]
MLITVMGMTIDGGGVVIMRIERSVRGMISIRRHPMGIGHARQSILRIAGDGLANRTTCRTRINSILL